MRIALWTAVGAAILISCRAIGPSAVEENRNKTNDCLGAEYDRYAYDERSPSRMPARRASRSVPFRQATMDRPSRESSYR